MVWEQLAPALNISTRGNVRPGHPMIAGSVVPGERREPTGDYVTSPEANEREVLIRVVGPSLTPLGVNDVWSDPDFVLMRSGSPSARSTFYRDWTTITHPRPGTGETVADANAQGAESFSKIFDLVGAFSLLENSKDAIDLVRLGPGAYSVVVRLGPDEEGGEVLVEVYFFP